MFRRVQVCLVVASFCVFSPLANSKVGIDMTMRIQDSMLSDNAKIMLSVQGFIKIEDVVRYFMVSAFPHQVSEEVTTFLDVHHLRLGMTDPEVEQFNVSGRAPPVTNVSSIRALNIGYRAIVSLESDGIKTIDDLLKQKADYLKTLPLIGVGTVKRIQQILAPLGFSLATQDPNCAGRL